MNVPVHFNDGSRLSPERANALSKATASHLLSLSPRGLTGLAFHPENPEFLFIVPTIIACRSTSVPFYSLDLHGRDPLSDQIPLTHIIGDEKSLNHLTKKKDIDVIERRTILEGLYALLLKTSEHSCFFLDKFEALHTEEQILYAVQTSGTTSPTRKFILATASSVEPNVADFRRCFTSVSGVIVSSPPGFDPFYVDIFYAVDMGLPIFLSAPSVRICSHTYTKYILKATASTLLLQMTPTLFNSLVLSDCASSVSKKFVFVLGGEPFPRITDSVPSNFTFFNIFGVTEMSAWQSMVRIIGSNEYPILRLGHNLISETNLFILDESGEKISKDGLKGEIVIQSEYRKCYVWNEDGDYNSTCFYKTGDIGSYRNGHLYHHGRSHTCNVIKINGKRMNLNEIVLRLQSILGSAVFHLDFNEENRLILYVVSESEESVSSRLLSTENYPSNMIPYRILRVPRIPFTPNGKIDVAQLRLLQNRKRRFKDPIAIEEVQFLWKKYTGRSPGDSNNFISDGGDSFTSLAFLNELGVNPSLYIEHILNRTFKELMEALGAPPSGTPNAQTSSLKQPPIDRVTHPSYSRRGFSSRNPAIPLPLSGSPSLAWSVDLKKCIDASVMVVEDSFAYVGSHSGLFICCSVQTGSLSWSVQLPDRIESSAIASSDYVFVGCYDHKLYAINRLSGKISWSYSTHGMIKSSPVLFMDQVLFGSYDHSVYCLQADSGALNWSKSFVDSSILASPVIHRGMGYITSLNGHAIKFDPVTGSEIWKVTLNSPVFSSGVIVSHHEKEATYVFGCAKGSIYGLNTESARLEWTFPTGKSIFSSVATSGKSLIAFGSHDSHLYMGKVLRGAFKLVSKIHVGGPLYATPYFFGPDRVIALSIEGRLIAACKKELLLDVDLPLTGQTFSSPLLLSNNNMLIFGCRDNYLYGFKL